MPVSDAVPVSDIDASIVLATGVVHHDLRMIGAKRRDNRIAPGPSSNLGAIHHERAAFMTLLMARMFEQRIAHLHYGRFCVSRNVRWIWHRVAAAPGFVYAAPPV